MEKKMSLAESRQNQMMDDSAQRKLEQLIEERGWLVAGVLLLACLGASVALSCGRLGECACVLKKLVACVKQLF